MMSKFLNTVWSYIPSWSKTQQQTSNKRSRESFETEELDPIPVKRQRINPVVLTESNSQAKQFHKYPELNLTKIKIVNKTKGDQKGYFSEHFVDLTHEDELAQVKKPKFFLSRYENLLKENILSAQNKSTSAASLSPSKFKNKHKAPRHIRSPSKIRNKFSLLSSSSVETIDLTHPSRNTFKRIPITMAVSKMNPNDTTSQNPTTSTRAPLYTNGKRLQDYTRDEYSRLLSSYISDPSKIASKDQAIKLDDTPLNAKGIKNDNEEDTIVIIDDDDERSFSVETVTTPKVAAVNSLSKKVKKHKERTDQILESTSVISAYKAQFDMTRNHYAEICHAQQLLRFKSIQDALNERIKNYLKVTEVVLDTKSVEALPELTPKMQQRIDEAFRPQPENEVLIDKFNYHIQRKDLNCLTKLNWLNDEVINFYMELIIERGKVKPHYPPVHTFSTFFFPRLQQSGHAGIRRWTRKVDIFKADMILVPIHLQVHWCMACINLKEKIITFYDSMGSANPGVLKVLKNYIECEHLDKKKEPYDTSDWKLISVKDIPQQRNGSDCGVFACTFAEFLAREAEFSFSQKDMPYFRRKMAYEILEGTLLT